MSEPQWELWRQDDNGQRFLVARFSCQSEAESQRCSFEEKGHKQLYWVSQSPKEKPKPDFELHSANPQADCS